MAVSEVATLAGLVLSTASIIQTAGNNWYKASASWKEFPRKVERLRQKQEFWLAEFTRSGLSSDRPLIEVLQEAQLLLSQENATLLKKSASCGAGCWPKLSLTVFPAQLGLSIENVITAFENIQGLLTYEEDAVAALDKRVLRRPFSLLVRKDHRYVPMQLYESAVHSTLDNVNVDGPAVVLLHGGPGKGKSTLARALALQYKEAANNVAANNAAANSAAVFDHVVYLECGPLANILAKQFNLLQLLGGFAAAPLEQAQRSDYDSDLTIPKRIRSLLRDQKLLIIFDDVWNAEFLQKMLDLCGRRVKCLVTSQRGDLCGGLNCLSATVQIEDVHLDDARKILASHVGFRNHLIPEHLEGIADEIIRETKGNPLALASVAMGIDKNRSDEQDAWEAAFTDLFEMLKLESSECILSRKYPRSFWSTMKLSFDSLTEGARNLLILVQMCSELSFPEEIIGLFYRRLSTKLRYNSVPFAIIRQELQNRELVKVTVVSEGPQTQRSYAWSVHSLVKRFIKDEMKDGTETTVTLLTEIASVVELEVDREVSLAEDTIVIILANFYLHDQFTMRAKMAASRMGIPSQRFNNLTRSAIEPIARLIGQPLSGRWTETLHNSAKRVLMIYMCTGVLNDEGILNLLGSPISALSVMIAIGDMATIEETMLLDENTHYFMNVLIDLLLGVDCGNNVRLREAAGEALSCLCRNGERGTFVLNNLPFVLEAIISLSLTEPEPQIRAWSTFILADLSRSSEFKAREKIVQYPGAVPLLVNLLTDNYHPSLKGNGACVLGNLACVDEIALKIADFGVIEALVKLLAKDDDLYLQEMVAGGLANLTTVDETRLKIANSNGAIEGLVKLLAKDDYPDLQEQAGRGLANLAQEDKISLEIVNSNGAIEGHVKLSYKDDDPHVQQEVTRSQVNLAIAHDIRLKIANFNGAIEGLVKLLYKDDYPHLQQEVTRGLANLALVHEVGMRIANSNEAIGGLLKLLSKDDYPTLQEQVAVGLANLAAVHEIGLKIGNSNGAIEGLVKLLSKDDYPILQERVVMVLANLAIAHEIGLKIGNSNGAIEGLVKLLSKDNYPTLQERVAMGLADLALVDEIGLKIANSNGAIEGLVKLLSKDDHPTLQELVAMGLANLALVDEIGLKIANSNGAIEGLVKLLSKDDYPNLQLQVARGLANLACVDEIGLKVANSNGAMEGLVKLLSKDDYPNLQRQAASGLGNLALVDEIGLEFANSNGALEGLVRIVFVLNDLDIQTLMIFVIHQLGETLFNMGIQGDLKARNLKLKLSASKSLRDGLLSLLAKHIAPSIQRWAIGALTFIYPEQVNKACLYSGAAYFGRGYAYMISGLFNESLADFDNVLHHHTHELPEARSTLNWYRCFVKAKLGDYQGALLDVNNGIKIERTQFGLQERGILKRMMGDLVGALADLNESINMETDDYECLKHRGYVKFLMKDYVGAVADAISAQQVKPSRVDNPRCGRDCLGTSSVAYMNYNLR